MSRKQRIQSTIHYLVRNPIECIGCGLGAIGSLLLSLNSDLSRYGWLAFLASNLLFAAMANKERLFGFLGLQAYFAITSIVGILRYF